MLERLVIHDVVLIEKLALELCKGLNVFTGETGAGKSILLDALGLALGERSDATLVRKEASQASVTAEFHLPEKHAVFRFAEEQGLKVEHPLILRRVIHKDGKSRAFINDQPVSIGLLKQFGERLLEIHGQFDTHGLLNPSSHRGLLDAYAGLQELQQKTVTAFYNWKKLQEAHDLTLTQRERAQNEEAFLRASVNELEELGPIEGEADQLAAKRLNLQHKEKILEALGTAQSALDGEKGAASNLVQAGKALARIIEKATSLSETLIAIDRVTQDVHEISQEVERILSSINSESETLQHIEERLFSLRSIARKHHVPVENLMALYKDLQARLELLSDQGDRLASLTKQVNEARKLYLDHATALSRKRKQSAIQLEKAVLKELPPLKLERAQFQIAFAELPEERYSAEGLDQINFLFAANPGVAPGPLQKIASGGELARFMLALKVVLAAADPVPVLVFDEVDAGIGGATASAVGERLARLADHVQILTVTHSPQVAARGVHHLRVIKRVKNKQALTEVEILGDEVSRREEIARMLAGTEITPAARQAAESLIMDAPPQKRAS